MAQIALPCDDYIAAHFYTLKNVWLFILTRKSKIVIREKTLPRTNIKKMLN